MCVRVRVYIYKKYLLYLLHRFYLLYPTSPPGGLSEFSSNIKKKPVVEPVLSKWQSTYSLSPSNACRDLIET